VLAVRFPHQFVLIILVGLLSACAFHVKTPVVADYQKLNSIDLSQHSRDDIQIKIGQPQGVGIHRIGDKSHEMYFYSGFAGVLSTSSAQYDSGTALVTYESGKPVDVLYYLSSAKGPAIKFDQDIPVKKIAGRLKPETTKIEEIEELLGPPAYQGRWLSATAGTNHRVAYYDSSVVEGDGRIKEKFLLLGYDDNRTVQDVVWVSSFPGDIQDFGEISIQKATQISRTQIVAFFPVDQPLEAETGPKLDPVMIESLLSKQPSNVAKIKEILGKPTAVGIKTFRGEVPLIISSWSQANIKVVGQEKRFVPPSATEEERKDAESSQSYYVMQVNQTRLMVGHDHSGTIREIVWFRPLAN
jgi:hypothetical protein